MFYHTYFFQISRCKIVDILSEFMCIKRLLIATFIEILQDIAMVYVEYQL